MTPWSWSGNLSLKPGTCLTVVRDLDQVRPTNVSSTEFKPVQVAPVSPPLPHPPGGLRFGLYYALLSLVHWPNSSLCLSLPRSQILHYLPLICYFPFMRITKKMTSKHMFVIVRSFRWVFKNVSLEIEGRLFVLVAACENLPCTHY